MPQQITKNFSFYEFGPHGAGVSWMPEFVLRSKMVELLASQLQVVRDEIGVPMVITRGVTTLEDQQRLINKGYFPSPTSDHFFGASVPLDPSNKKYPLVGPSYNFAVGAADCVPKNITIRNFFASAVKLNESKKCQFGQIIYEYNPATHAEWVHFGNNPSAFFSPMVTSIVGRSKYMQSLDGGKTYQVFTPT